MCNPHDDLADFKVPEPREHPLSNKIIDLYFKRIGRVTICTAFFRRDNGVTIGITDVAVRMECDKDDPKIGRKIALWKTLERFRKSQERKKKK